jgi:hypothetical protein
MSLLNATVEAVRAFREGDSTVIEQTLSGLTSSALVNLPTRGESALAPNRVDFTVTTKPTDGSAVSMVWEASDTTDTEVDLRFRADGGGSLSGCILKVYLKYLDEARQDGTSINTDNDD